MPFFYYKLNAPRATFPADITKDEITMMQAHVLYWTNILEMHKAVVFGPVVHPEGAFGVAILEVQDEAEALSLVQHDPAILSNLGFGSEVYPMAKAIART
ncbi:YciI family protein [Flavihumibacter solisilvae]|uniref:YCII-related domain-containing protein n=1 Tax=Flavihumibacter solisilvae TaxID=1349421 RepID=A0A0C1IKA3_9BACT|nr:YciI family protein [Flavihumibacter solisilvae]KIC94610.1 hypothetical protein OI18_10950 [Flavihumibacter solisilvae]